MQTDVVQLLEKLSDKINLVESELINIRVHYDTQKIEDKVMEKRVGEIATRLKDLEIVLEEVQTSVTSVNRARTRRSKPEPEPPAKDSQWLTSIMVVVIGILAGPIIKIIEYILSK